jgi:hypothetical protein
VSRAFAVTDEDGLEDVGVLVCEADGEDLFGHNTCRRLDWLVIHKSHNRGSRGVMSLLGAARVSRGALKEVAGSREPLLIKH